jgi:Xaa-Pro aminopeptidase
LVGSFAKQQKHRSAKTQELGIMANHAQRRERIQRRMRKEGLSGLLVTNEVNVRYLTGFTGDSSYLLLTPTDQWILSDARYDEQLTTECPDLDAVIRRPPQTLVEILTATATPLKLRHLALESDAVTLSLHDQLASGLPAVELVATRGWVEQLREIKDREEIRAIRRAIQVAERAFGVIRAGLRGEQTEMGIAAHLEHQIRDFGGEGFSFPAIVAAGPRAALPHARPTHSSIGGSGSVLFDWGAVVDGYRSDLTRLLTTAKIPPKLERVYQVVLTAQQQAIAVIRPGALLSEVDAVARGIIDAAGFGKRFGHGLGHGFGLEIHEQPRLAPRQDRPLQKGMVVTVEPGIYIPGWGGVRIEDDILVTHDGHEVLSSLPKELDSCVAEGLNE